MNVCVIVSEKAPGHRAADPAGADVYKRQDKLRDKIVGYVEKRIQRAYPSAAKPAKAERIIRLEDGRVVYDGDSHSPDAVVQSTFQLPQEEREMCIRDRSGCWGRPEGEKASLCRN